MLSLTRRALLLGGAGVAFWVVVRPRVGLAAAGTVLNETTGVRGGDLAQAIARAAPGDVLRLSGHHIGQFVIDKPLTLAGEPGAMLDAGGRGSALVIAGDHVAVSGLVLTGSGQTATHRTLWGDAGLRIEGSRARIAGAEIFGNDFGVVMLGGQGSTLISCDIHDNRGEGIKIFGGEGHDIADNRIALNRIGVYVDALYEGGRLTEILMPEIGDPEKVRRYGAMKDSAVHAHHHRIERNRVSGNEIYGLFLCWYTHHCTVAGNDVGETGVLRPISEAATRYWEETWSAAVGAAVRLDRAMLGSGMLLVCFPHHNEIAANTVHDNLAWGVGLDSTSHDNRLAANSLARNRVGLKLEGAKDNELRANAVEDNSAYGIDVDVLDGVVPFAPASSGNLFVLNDLRGNAVNARDTSDHVFGEAEFLAALEDYPFPKELREMMAVMPQIRAQMAAQMRATLQPGTNRWDDGALGNHYDDFDEPAEGFRDADGDGVGDVAHPIPGGGMVDRFPLTADRVAAG